MTGAPGTPVFQASGITKVYRMGEVDVHALRGVDVAFGEGELVVLLGPSGSGKSTLLNVLGGLDVPTAGAVRWRDHDLADPDEALLTRYRRDHVGFVFQFYNLVPSLTARENVALAAEIARHPMAPEEALGLVGLSARLDHFPAQLSGGEQQRVAIARAVVKRPDVLLLRRAHRRARRRHRPARARGARPGEPGARHHHGGHHPQRRRCRARRPGPRRPARPAGWATATPWRGRSWWRSGTTR